MILYSKEDKMEHQNNLQEGQNEGRDKFLLGKLKNYINKTEFISKFVVIIPALYAALYFFQNIIYKFNCENLYGISSSYFSYNADHNILVVLCIGFVIAMFAYTYFIEKASKKTKMDYVGDWLYKIGTGLIIGIVCIAMYSNIAEIFIKSNNTIINAINILFIVLVFACGTASVFVVFGKQHKLKKLSTFIVLATLLVLVFGFVKELYPLDKAKTAYEFVEIENKQYAILSKVDDKILVVPCEYDETGKCHIKTSEYTFKDKYEGTYSYKDLNSYPIIEK